MEKGRLKIMRFRWGMAASILTFIFWCAWHQVRGSVPEITEIRIKDWLEAGKVFTFSLPFGVSRWWDVIPAYVFGSSLAFGFDKAKGDIILPSIFALGYPAMTFFLPPHGWSLFGIFGTILIVFVAGAIEGHLLWKNKDDEEGSILWIVGLFMALSTAFPISLLLLVFLSPAFHLVALAGKTTGAFVPHFFNEMNHGKAIKNWFMAIDR